MNVWYSFTPHCDVAVCKKKTVKIMSYEEMRVPHEGMGVLEEYTRNLMEHGDTDGDGMLNFEEFKVIYKMQRNQG